MGFGMKVIYHNRSRLDAGIEAACKASYVSKEELLKTADHLVLVLPYSAAAHHTIGAAELAQMKPTATLVNIARGGIVDDAALAAALRNKTIAAAGLDVFEGEPKVHPDLLTLPNVVLTPHIASATLPTRSAMANLAADNLIFVLPLLLVLAGIAYAVAPLVDQLTLSWFVRDLDIRSSLIANTIQEPLQEQLGGRQEGQDPGILQPHHPGRAALCRRLLRFADRHRHWPAARFRRRSVAPISTAGKDPAITCCRAPRGPCTWR